MQGMLTYFKLLVDPRIKSRMCWWEKPSMLSPLMVMMTSPVMVSGDRDEDVTTKTICRPRNTVTGRIISHTRAAKTVSIQALWKN